MIQKHFSKDHKLHKIFNTDTIKLSYSCMLNMFSVIKQHNQKVLSSWQTNEKCECNFRNPANCPLDWKCLTKNIVYKAVLSTITNSHTYYGSSEDFKFRHNNNTKSFFYTNIIKMIQNFLNIYGTLKTQDFIIASPGVLLVIPQHTDVVQEVMIPVSQKSTS